MHCMPLASASLIMCLMRALLLLPLAAMSFPPIAIGKSAAGKTIHSYWSMDSMPSLSQANGHVGCTANHCQIRDIGRDHRFVLLEARRLLEAW